MTRSSGICIKKLATLLLLQAHPFSFHAQIQNFRVLNPDKIRVVSTQKVFGHKIGPGYYYYTMQPPVSRISWILYDRRIHRVRNSCPPNRFLEALKQKMKNNWVAAPRKAINQGENIKNFQLSVYAQVGGWKFENPRVKIFISNFSSCLLLFRPCSFFILKRFFFSWFKYNNNIGYI